MAVANWQWLLTVQSLGRLPMQFAIGGGNNKNNV